MAENYYRFTLKNPNESLTLGVEQPDQQYIAQRVRSIDNDDPEVETDAASLNSADIDIPLNSAIQLVTHDNREYWVTNENGTLHMTPYAESDVDHHDARKHAKSKRFRNN